MRRPRHQQRDIDAWVANLPDEYVLCRDTSIGHNWQPFQAWWDDDLKSYQRVIRCKRCKTEKPQTLAMSGHVLAAQSYAYPEGYQAPAGTGYLDVDDRASIRLESTLRLMATDELTTRKRKRNG